MYKLRSILPGLALLLLYSCVDNKRDYDSWKVYNGSKEGIHYSSLAAIDTGNVNMLQPAWLFHTGDADTAKSSQIQCNPIIVDSVMYVTSPTLKLFALQAATGRKIWEFDPESVIRNKDIIHFIVNNNRGVTYWTDGKEDKRIFFVAGAYLHCINAVTGELVINFADSGRFDLHKGLGWVIPELYITATTPGIIYKDLFILGSRVDEGPAAAPGHIRAFDVRTGEIKWVFHTIPQPGEFGHDTWENAEAWKYIGGANSWSGFTLDEERGILFAPTGSASFDFYGGKRLGQNLFANCLLAIDAATGRRIWHFQVVHHDLWDWDLPTAPVLITLHKDGKTIDAVAQPTKHGMVYVFERETGKPVYPVSEISVDTVTAITDEKVWPTQPYSRAIEPFVRQQFTEKDINPYLPDSSLQKIKNDLKGYRYGKMFIPPGKQTAVQLPGLDGGAEWGGPAYDPETQVLYVNANEMAWLMTIRENEQVRPLKENYGQAGLRLYKQQCTSCHGLEKKGTGNYPSLDNLQARYTSGQVAELIRSGRRMMPSFNHLDGEEQKAIVAFIMEDKKEMEKRFTARPKPMDTYRNLPYGITGYYKFLSPEGYPAIAPPWGTLTAINLQNGEHIWKNVLGDYQFPEMKDKGFPSTGTENYGGPVVTAGGLLFIAATSDGKIRAFNKWNGKLLWEYLLPAPGFATPAIYSVKGRQYLVIACGGGKLNTKSGDIYMAFALPDK